MKLFLILILLQSLLLVGCAHKDETKTTEVWSKKGYEKENKLSLGEVLFTMMFNAPRPKVGDKYRKVKDMVKARRAKFVKVSDELRIAQIRTKDTPYEADFDYCSFKYYFKNSRFVRGPIITGECRNKKYDNKKT